MELIVEPHTLFSLSCATASRRRLDAVRITLRRLGLEFGQQGQGQGFGRLVRALGLAWGLVREFDQQGLVREQERERELVQVQVQVQVPVLAVARVQGSRRQ